MKREMVPTWTAFVAALAVVFVGFVWASFFTEAPYTAMVGAVTALTGSYLAKRYGDKKVDEARNSRIEGCSGSGTEKEQG